MLDYNRGHPPVPIAEPLNAPSPASTFGQYTTFGGYERVRQGNVLFCGEHTSIDFQGFMEGAASEGRHAARQLAGMLVGD